MSRLDLSSQNFSQNDDRYFTLSTLVLRVRGSFSVDGDGESVDSFIPYRRICDEEEEAIVEVDVVDVVAQLNELQPEIEKPETLAALKLIAADLPHIWSVRAAAVVFGPSADSSTSPLLLFPLLSAYSSSTLRSWSALASAPPSILLSKRFSRLLARFIIGFTAPIRICAGSFQYQLRENKYIVVFWNEHINIIVVVVMLE